MILDKDYILNKIKGKTVYLNGCWIYTGAKVSGHGYIRVGKKMYYTHRLSAYIFLGLSLDSNLQSNHKPICNNGLCWNPDHLYAGTQKDNVNDALPNMRNKSCKNGHIITGKIWCRDTGKFKGYCTICESVRKRKAG